MSRLTSSRVRHTVVFSLVHEPGSAGEDAFLGALAGLSAVPGVEELEVVRETSPKNSYTHAVVMEFADPDAYAAYDAHPDHVAFVRDRWAAEVHEFLEVDLQAHEGAAGRLS